MYFVVAVNTNKGQMSIIFVILLQFDLLSTWQTCPQFVFIIYQKDLINLCLISIFDLIFCFQTPFLIIGLVYHSHMIVKYSTYLFGLNVCRFISGPSFSWVFILGLSSSLLMLYSWRSVHISLIISFNPAIITAFMLIFFLC